VAADSIEMLRKDDVYRVISEAPAHFRLALSMHIKEKRADLAQEVDDVMSEISGQAGASTGATSGDISYRQVDSMFTAFYPDSKAGEGAWKIINAMPGSEGGKILSQHADSVIEQLRAAGYVVTEAAPVTESADEIHAALTSDPAPTADPERASATDYLQSILSGSYSLNDADLFTRLEAIGTQYADDAEMMDLFTRAAQVVTDAAQEAAKAAI
jgi:hypothetical protein